ncbi:MAG: alpha/beta fold hydrolase [bacterium]
MPLLHSDRIVGSDGQIIRADVHGPDQTPKNLPIVVICHGFKGFKEWGFFPWVAEELGRRGFAAVRFDFSHNGVGDNAETFERLDLFAKNTYSRELEDLDKVLGWVRGPLRRRIANCDPERVGLLGHSRGGGIVVVRALEDSGIRAVATWAGISNFERDYLATKDQWELLGQIEIFNSRTGQRMPIDLDLIGDIESNRERFALKQRLSSLHCPYLIVHGEKDESVGVDEAHLLGQYAPSHLVTTHIVADTGHTFDCVHPFKGSTPALHEAIGVTAEFFKRHLKEDANRSAGARSNRTARGP